MDSDSEGEDMEDDKFKKYIKAASDMLIEFEKVYYGDHYRKGNSKYQLNNSKSYKILQKEKKKKVEHVQACLRPILKKEIDLKSEKQGEKEKRLVFLEEEDIRIR